MRLSLFIAALFVCCCCSAQVEDLIDPAKIIAKKISVCNVYDRYDFDAPGTGPFLSARYLFNTDGTIASYEELYIKDNDTVRPQHTTYEYEKGKLTAVKRYSDESGSEPELTKLYSYLPNGKLHKVIKTGNNFTENESETYTYNAAGKLTTIEMRSVEDGVEGEEVQQKTIHKYDAAGKLIETHSFFLDPDNNKMKTTASDIHIYTYDPKGRLIKNTSKVVGSGRTLFPPWTYEYDNDGLLVKVNGNNGLDKYVQELRYK